jgi:RNA-directed DNA polymerase
VRKGQSETEPAGVPGRAKQAGEVRGRWPWVEPSVWTERMLTALEAGVKGGSWFSLIDKVYDLRNLDSAYQKVKQKKGSAGVDHVTISQFTHHLERNLETLSTSLKNGDYRQ